LSEVLKTEIESIKSAGSKPISLASSDHKTDRTTSLVENIQFALGDMFGHVDIETFGEGGKDSVAKQPSEMHVSVDSGRTRVVIDLDKGEVSSEADTDMDKKLKQVITNVVGQIKNFS
jgi:hypothetical protein